MPGVSGDNSLALGYNNSVSGGNSIILGGSNNNVTSNFSAVLAGNTNKITGNYSSILNGNNNLINNNYSLSSGYGSKSTKLGQISHSLGYFNVIGDSQISTYIFRRSITHSTTNYYDIGINNLDPLSDLDGGIQLSNSQMLSYVVNIVGISTTNNKFWNFKISGAIFKNDSGIYIHTKGSKEIIVKNKKSDDIEINYNNTYGIYISARVKDIYTVQWTAKMESVECKL